MLALILVVPDDHARLQLEPQLDLIALLPFLAQRDVAVRRAFGFHGLAIDPHCIGILAPRGDAQLERERLALPRGCHSDADAARRRDIACLVVTPTDVPSRSLQLGGAGIVKVHHHAVGIGGDGEGRDEGDAARAAGEAAMAVEGAAVGLLALHLHVIAPGRAVADIGRRTTG